MFGKCPRVDHLTTNIFCCERLELVGGDDEVGEGVEGHGSVVVPVHGARVQRDIDSYLDKIGSKAPQSWRKPRSRIYDHNRTLGHEYYQVCQGVSFTTFFMGNPSDNLNFFLSI